MERARAGRIVHQPFGSGECSQCHIAGQKVTPSPKQTTLVREKEQREKIRWFLTSGERAAEHLFRLSDAQVANGLFLNASDGRSRSPLLEISVPSGELPEMEVDQQAPIQSGLVVTDVRRGISTAATLQWETDKYTDSVIYYGVGNLRSVKASRQLARRHSQVLLRLDADKTYSYQVVSRDLFGNETRSAVQEFSTKKSFWDQDAVYSSETIATDDVRLDWQFYRLGAGVVLRIGADRPVNVSVGSEEQEDNKALVEREVRPQDDFSHPILKSSLDTNVSICRDCHQSFREEYSHPIKVRAPKGMTIPPEYPLLPDGTMSCMTCHDSHTSNNPKRILKANKSDLCRGCHKDY